MKLLIIVFNYLANNICYELVSLFRCYKFISSFNKEDAESINDSLITLTSVALTSNNMDISADLNKKYIF